MEFLSLTSAVLSVVLLIVFIVMASNVAQIKKSLTSRHQDARINYYAALATGNKQAAYENLLVIVFEKLTTPDIDVHGRKASYAQLKEKYEPAFKTIGYDFPADPF